MINICIVHHSITGTTSRLAASVLEGVGGVDGCIGKVLAISGEDIVDGRFKNEAVLHALDTSVAMIFGCPTFMGLRLSSRRLQMHPVIGGKRSVGKVNFVLVLRLARIRAETSWQHFSTSPYSRHNMACCGSGSTFPENAIHRDAIALVRNWDWFRNLPTQSCQT
jgi:hypothetical protein